MTKLIGHEDAWENWRSSLNGGRMHHAWLLAGPVGLGKMHFARAAAHDLIRKGDDLNRKGDDLNRKGDDLNRKGDDLNRELGENTAENAPRSLPEFHPDIITLERLPKDEKEEKKRQEGKPFERKRNITVAQIRAMQQRLTTRPTTGAHRAILIDSSDDLEKGASNALLKSLEEPPQGTFFLLIAHRPARLLPTIRSRCRILRFPAIEKAELARWLEQETPEADPATIQAAVMAATGSPGRALEFMESDLGEISAIMQQLAQQGDPDFRLRGALTKALGTRPNRERVLAVIDLARSVLGAGISADVCSATGNSGTGNSCSGNSSTGSSASGISGAGGINPLALIESHSRLATLSAQAPSYNFDANLLITEIGTLLAAAAKPSERRNA